jgi:hypothetical protein
MTATYDDAELKSRAITARVTGRFYEAFVQKAAEVPGRTSAELARQVLERFVYGEPDQVALMAELLALRRIVVRGLLFPEVEMTRPAVQQLLAETDTAKLSHALNRLGLAAREPSGTSDR